MSDQYWSWILGFVGLIGFYLAGKKVWWCWYINIANQVLWTAYSLVTDQFGFLVATAFYFWVFSKNAYSWTKEHFNAKKPNRDNYCWGRWDGQTNWVANACNIPGIPHAPHDIPEQDQGWNLNRVAMPRVELFDNDDPDDLYVEPEPFKHPLRPKYEAVDELTEGQAGVFCSGRPIHPLCELPILAHKPHFIMILDSSEE